VSAPDKAGLVRAIGRWSLAALVINSIIGSGIFGLPSIVARQVGRWAPLAYLIAAAGMGVIMACFAEVASRFREAGGPYLYARVAFGRFAGIQMGWLAWLVRLTSAGANANLFVIYLGQFWPGAQEPFARALILLALIGFLAAVNIVGVSAGARLSNLFTVAKILPLVVFIIAGLAVARGVHPVGAATGGSGEWLKALLVLVFVYGGFESALMPMSEAKNPERDAPFALFAALVTCATVYTLIHLVVMTYLPDPLPAEQPLAAPLAAAAQKFMGSAGAALISVGAMVSVYGLLSGIMLGAPRLTFAFAEQKDFPQIFARVHNRFRTPHWSIVICAGLSWLVAVKLSFVNNAVLSAVARLLTYGLVCVALPVLRRKQPGGAAFRLPAWPVFVGLGLVFCVVLVARMGRAELVVIASTAALALVNWLWVRRPTQ
jgi:APA family basic amino acid/polyamine antiporter